MERKDPESRENVLTFDFRKYIFLHDSVKYIGSFTGFRRSGAAHG
jgi:hypothetical protein